jgi:hypothetical protein
MIADSPGFLRALGSFGVLTNVGFIRAGTKSGASGRPTSSSRFVRPAVKGCVERRIAGTERHQPRVNHSGVNAFFGGSM